MACAGPAPASENTGKAETNEQKEKETKTEEMKPAEKAEATEIGSQQKRIRLTDRITSIFFRKASMIWSRTMIL